MTFHTEKDARTRWCPESFSVAAVFNEHGVEIQCAGPWVCRASECMAWRKHYEYREGNELARFGDGWVILSSGMDWARDTGTGYCGKAGKP